MNPLELLQYCQREEGRSQLMTEFSNSTTVRLTGGMINRVWRLTNPEGKTVIVKYVESTMSQDQTQPFAVDRMVFEARGLRLVAELPVTDGIQVPKLLYSHEEEPWFLILEDIGQLLNFEEWSCHQDSLEEDKIWVCGRVGEWLARLHAFGHQHRARLEPLFTNIPAREFLNQVFESAAEKTQNCANLNNGAELAIIIRNSVSEAIDESSRTLLFGDMWSGSVLFDKEQRLVNILDFEFADYGCIYKDIAHFVAHLLPIFCVSQNQFPTISLVPPTVRAFLTSYRDTLQNKYPLEYKRLVTKQTVRQCGVFLGIEILHDVLTGNWCLCGSKGNTAECKCLDAWLEFGSRYIQETIDNSLFNILF